MKSNKKREDLIGEHTLGDTGQLILACLFFAIWIADTFFLQYTTILNQFAPLFVRLPIGIIILILSGLLAYKGHSIVFGERRDPPVVIRKGVFGIVRHPIYLSEILLYFGFIAMSISLASIVIWFAAIGFLHYISRTEEKRLTAYFGDDYRQYMKDVPMWIPRLR